MRVALPFAELAGRYLVWEQGLEGEEMTESAVVNEWTREARRETRIETIQEAVVEVLKSKFTTAVNMATIAMIESQSDMDTLRDWLKQAAIAGSWEQFQGYLRHGN